MQQLSWQNIYIYNIFSCITHCFIILAILRQNKHRLINHKLFVRRRRAATPKRQKLFPPNSRCFHNAFTIAKQKYILKLHRALIFKQVVQNIGSKDALDWITIIGAFNMRKVSPGLMAMSVLDKPS